MPLPKISTSQHELILPSTGKTVKYRPFLVREEKVLILALESKDPKQITNAIKQVLKDCILTRGVKVEELPSFDIEYLFLNIRGKSVGESIDLIVTCGDDGKTTVPVTVYIDDIVVEKDPEHSTDISLGDYTLRMKYPSLQQFVESSFGENADNNDIEGTFGIIASCIEMVFDEEEMWAASDCTKKELREWIESLTSEQFNRIEKFFQTMPKLTHTITVTNPNTGNENSVVLEGLTDFFG